jgi:uncharacterized membrane protein
LPVRRPFGKKAAVARLPFIDWVRGFAVVAMVLWHTGDAWLSPGLRDGQGWLFLRFVGGLAAPSFLFLAGAAAGLSARPGLALDARQKALRASLGRGLEIVLIGYLLRYQTWMIDAAAIRQLGAARAWLPLGLGYGALVVATRKLDVDGRKAVLWALGGLALCVAGYAQVESVAPGRLRRLLQVDVLQAIGMSLVLLALLERGFGLLQKARWLLLLGFAVALATEPLARLLPGPLPGPLAGYLGKWAPPPGQPAAALFPLFPWFAYACFGAAVGLTFRRGRDHAERLVVAFSVGGAALAMVTSEAHVWVRDLMASAPWLVSPLRLAFRIGIVLALFLVGHLWASRSRGRVLLDYGRASLRVYWAHMLFAYGILGRSLHKSTSYLGWLAFATLLLAAMWGLAQLGKRRPPPRVQGAAPAK